MAKTQCISEEQRECIEAKTTDKECIEQMLAIMMRRSIEDYNKLIECLVEEDQCAAAQMLFDNGGKLEIF